MSNESTTRRVITCSHCGKTKTMLVYYGKWMLLPDEWLSNPDHTEFVCNDFCAERKEEPRG